jgi:hypothetical protein
MARKPTSLLPALVLALGVAATADCDRRPASPAASGADASAFQADPPTVYVAKVKNLLVGLPPTDEEVQAVTRDPGQLAHLIDGWMAMPEYTRKMMVFFGLAFQQTQITLASFVDMMPPYGMQGTAMNRLAQNARESFARTVLELIAEGRPLSDAMTTKRFMMTPPLMELYALLDTYHVDDQASITDDFAAQNPDAVAIEQGAAGLSGITPAEAADPTSPGYMRWYNPLVPGYQYQTIPVCDGIDPVVYAPSSYALHHVLYGCFFDHNAPDPAMTHCGVRDLKGGTVFSDADFGAWRMVTVRPPNAGEATTRLYDVAALRAADEIVIRTPRVGFFSTPAFFANWSTNQSNQMRVTANQTLIVATGMAVDGTDPTVPPSTPGLDAQHAQPHTACYACHQTLDPTRAILSSTWTYAYYTQLDPAQVAQKGLFAFQGVVESVGSIDDFAGVLAAHPALPEAWAQKLCYYASSSPCLHDDPEFQRVVGVFERSKLSWSALVRELFSSPLTTNASPTMTRMNGEVVAVVRRDHLCAALEARLGLVDPCALDVTTPASTLSAIADGLPSDGYGRGSPVPVLPAKPTLFYRAGLEHLCEAVAEKVIDAPPDPTTPKARRWSSDAPDAAISDFVSLIMGLVPSDPRAAPAEALLRSHFKAAAASGPGNALRSTFTAACLAPSALGVGM